jgi:hypothetical protein
MKKLLSVFALLIFWGTSFAQQPFEEYGYKVKMATLSKGKYNEFFDQDTVVQIGSVFINRMTGKIRYFVMYDTVYHEFDLKPELISRWTSPDPLADHFYNESPYNFVHNNPIRYTDPSGMAPEECCPDKKQKTVDDLNPLEKMVVAFALVMDKIGGVLNERNGVESPSMDQNIVTASNFVGEVVMGTQAHSEMLQPSGNTSKITSKVDDVANQAKAVTSETKAVSKEVSSVTSFIVDSKGTAFPVPKGATGPTPVVNQAGNVTGVAFTGGKGGANGQVSSMRIMNAVPARGNAPAYPAGYIKYENAQGQGVNPYTGRTGSKVETHYPLPIQKEN